MTALLSPPKRTNPAWLKWLFWLPILWLAWQLRLPALFNNTFHADEALFATFARYIAVWRDPLLLTQPVDKPPLLFYAQALFYPLFGPVSWAARMPNFLASLLLIPLTGRLAGQLYRGSRVGMMTAVLLTLSPLAIQFSATAFTDPLLLFWLTAALLALSAPANRPGWSGFFWGLGLATKYQAVLFLPLLLGIAVLQGRPLSFWSKWFMGLFLPLALLFFWLLARPEAALWSSQLQNFGGLRWSFSWELWPRMRAWWAALGYLGPWPLLLIIGVLMAWRIGNSSTSALPDAGVNRDFLFFLFALGYLLFHWLVAVPVWDRYLLLLLPVAALLGARTVIALWEQGRFWSLPLIFLLGGWLLWHGVQAGNGRFPIGGYAAADGGAAQLSQVLAGEPYGTVLYDHWYSWQWRYHMFDKRVYVSWFPHGSALIADLTAFGETGSRRYIALPADGTAVPLRRTIHDAGFALSPVAAAGDIELYLLRPEAISP